jgi:hypothetical protein
VAKRKKDLSEADNNKSASLTKLPLYTFEMCKNCTKKCKMAGIKGAVLEYCPDFHQI